MEVGDGLRGRDKVAPAPTVISQNAPVLESGDDMLDARASLARSLGFTLQEVASG